MKALKFKQRQFVRLTFDQDIRRDMRSLWLRKRMVSANEQELESYYAEAFDKFLFKNRIPKQIRKRKRTQARLLVSGETYRQIEGLAKIAKSRQQPLATILEEALEEFLTLPENFMGTDRTRKEYRENLENTVSPISTFKRVTGQKGR